MIFQRDTTLGSLNKRPPYFKWFVIFCFLAFCLFVIVNLFAPKNFPKDKIFYFEDGITLKQLSIRLENENLVKSKLIFQTVVVFVGGENKINSGFYKFENSDNAITLASKIIHGIHGIPQAKITIPEGFTNVEIAKAFSAKLPQFDQQDFLDKVISKEGYLFPETYFFYITEGTDAVIKKMETTFSKKVDSLFVEKTKLSKEKTIILASLIEAEASGQNDREIISGILYNRLAKGERLQVDVARETYKVAGLPAKPICNPGLASIKAAINPTESNYYFYLHDKSGNIHFAKTYAEHLLNIKKYLK